MLSVGLGVPKGALLSTERAQGWGDRRAKADATSFPGWPQVLRLQPPGRRYGPTLGRGQGRDVLPAGGSEQALVTSVPPPEEPEVLAPGRRVGAPHSQPGWARAQRGRALAGPRAALACPRPAADA